MKCVIEMGSSGMIYILSFIKTGLGIKKLLKRDTHTDTQATDSKVIS
jgi:hypothetical protein